MPETNQDKGRSRKGQERRREIVAAAADLFAADGYRHSSIRELAKRVGLSQAGVLHHFADKQDLLVEVLELRDASVAEHLSADPESDAAARSRGVAQYAEHEQGLTSLFVALSAEAIAPDHPAHAYFVDHYRKAKDKTRPHNWDAAAEVSTGVSGEMIATLGIAVMDGLQVQRRYRDDLNVVEAVDAFWKLVAAAGRSSTPAAPIGSGEGRAAP